MKKGLLTESARIQEEFFARVSPLIRKWQPYVDGIREAKEGISDWDIATTVLCLENVYREYRRKYGMDLDNLMESTNTGAIGSFIKHGFDMIAAIMPSLIANEIISVQPLTRRKGEVFYMEYLYGTDKGRIHAGDKMFARDVVGNDEIWYSHETVPDFQLVQVGAAPAPGPFTGVINQQLPIRPGTVEIKVVSAADSLINLVATDDGAGNLIGQVLPGGTINYTSGQINGLTWNANAAANAWNLVTFRTNFETHPENIPEVDLSITSATVEALDRKLKAKYTMDFGYDMQEAFGLNPEQLLSTGLASEVRKEIDGELLQFIYDSADVTSPAVWDPVPDGGISYAEHKWTFIDTLIEASSNIFDATRRAQGTFIVAGLSVCNVIESLAPRFKKQGRVQPGPHFIGTLDDTWRVYKNPFFGRKKYMMGYKGEQWIEAGCIYAPYMPIFMTRPIMLDDFINRRGLATAYGKFKVNGKFYVKGEIE